MEWILDLLRVSTSSLFIRVPPEVIATFWAKCAREANFLEYVGRVVLFWVGLEFWLSQGFDFLLNKVDRVVNI